MKRSMYILMSLAAILTLDARASVGAQGKTGSGTWGFVNARYDTRSSASIYTGYGWRGAFAMGGVLNTRSGQAEVLGGVGVVVRTGPNANHWLAIAKGQTGPVSTAQVYWLPTLRTGALTTRATVKWSVPYKGSTVRKLSVSPLSLLLPATPRLTAGIAVDMAAADRSSTSFAAGPELRVRLPHAVLVADALRDVSGQGSRLRLFFASMF